MSIPTTSADDSDDYEEEECLVYLDFEAKFLEDQLKDPNLQIDIIGIDTDCPIMQMNSKLFRGKCQQNTSINVICCQNAELILLP